MCASPLDLADEMTDAPGQLLLGGQDDNPRDDEAAPGAGHEAGQLPGDHTLHQEGQDQLEAAQAGHHVGGDQLQGQGQASKRRQAAGGQS